MSAHRRKSVAWKSCKECLLKWPRVLIQCLRFQPSASILVEVILTEARRVLGVKKIQWLGDSHICTCQVLKRLGAQPATAECSFVDFVTVSIACCTETWMFLEVPDTYHRRAHRRRDGSVVNFGRKFGS